MRFVWGMITGAGVTFLILASWLLYVLRPIMQQRQTGLGVIAAATIWSPVFWGFGLGIALIALGLIFRYVK